MARLLSLTFLALLLAFSLSVYALPPHSQPDGPQAPAEYDQATWIDANNILMFVSNYGPLAHDFGGVFGRSEGLYFPYTGVADIQNGTNDKAVVYQAGLWIGGKVNNEIRVSVSEYSWEYFPGPMLSGTYIPGADVAPEYRVYRLHGDSLAGNPNTDYLEWPIDQGAPYDVVGVDTVPAMVGDQMLWAVFNDANADEHWVSAGKTEPLGVEVRQTVWASDEPGEENVIYVKYLLFNEGGNTIDSCFVSFWCDPDLGGANDDLVGCDSARNIGFCYNAGGIDTRYGSQPPAFGVRLTSGPVVPSPGDAAEFDGNPLPDFRNLEIYSFNKYINGTDPSSAQESFNYMRGLDHLGAEIINPSTGLPSRFYGSGDPLTDSGWLDSDPSDRRFMVTTGPFMFAPGDSQQVVYKFAAGQGESRLHSIDVMKSLLDSTYTGTPQEVVPVESAIIEIPDIRDLKRVYFVPDSVGWLSPLNWGGRFFGGAVDLAAQYWGAGIRPETNPQLFNDIEVRFSRAVTQRAYFYRRGGPPENYGYFGYFDVPFQVWDTEHDRQVNVACVENFLSTVADSTWGPSLMSDNLGGREYLMPLSSDYSGDLPTDADPFYTSKNLQGDAADFDALFLLWPALAEGHTLDELDDGQKLVFNIQNLNLVEHPGTIRFEPALLGDSSFQKVSVEAACPGISAVRIFTSDPGQFITALGGFHFGIRESRLFDVWFKPSSIGESVATLYVEDSVSGGVIASVELKGVGLATVTGRAEAMPDPLPPIPKWDASVYLGDFSGAYTADSVDQSTLMINGRPARGVTLLPSYGDFTGPVLDLAVRVMDVTSGEYSGGDDPMVAFSISGGMTDGTAFTAEGAVDVYLVVALDIDESGIVDSSDLSLLAGYLFNQLPSLPAEGRGDANGDADIDSSDLGLMVRYLFQQ